jgi:hypothetical protein
MKEFIQPLRERRDKIADDKKLVQEALKGGAEKVRPQAREKLQKVRKATGLSL